MSMSVHRSRMLLRMSVVSGALVCLSLASFTALAVDKPAGKASKTAIFAGGCFWCIESDFEKLPGVIEAVSGYTGGTLENPTYKQVSNGGTGHTEAVRVAYDPQKISYAKLVEYFWRHIDPTEGNGQFCDKGPEYRSGIYWLNEVQRQVAIASRDKLLATGKFKEIHTELLPAKKFWLAEDYHQDYYKKKPFKYKIYRKLCGRDARVKELWEPQ